jgi:hypothetical protein
MLRWGSEVHIALAWVSPQAADAHGSGINQSTSSTAPANPWSGVDWIPCRDGKFRPVEPGTFRLAHGVPGRVGRLRGYGNAIVSQVAAAFINDIGLSTPVYPEQNCPAIQSGCKEQMVAGKPEMAITNE